MATHLLGSGIIIIDVLKAYFLVLVTANAKDFPAPELSVYPLPG